jgi:hypothetical protein
MTGHYFRDSQERARPASLGSLRFGSLAIINLPPRDRSLADDRTWSGAGAPDDEIVATFLTVSP